MMLDAMMLDAMMLGAMMLEAMVGGGMVEATSAVASSSACLAACTGMGSMPHDTPGCPMMPQATQHCAAAGGHGAGGSVAGRVA